MSGPAPMFALITVHRLLGGTGAAAARGSEVRDDSGNFPAGMRSNGIDAEIPSADPRRGGASHVASRTP